MGDDLAVKKRFRIALDISRPLSNRAFTLVEGDTGNELLIVLTDDGVPVDLDGCRVMALFSKSDGTTVSQDSGTDGNGVFIGGENGNEITIALFPSSFAPGMAECEVQIYSGAALATLVTSAKFNFRCRRSILNPDTIRAVPDYPLLTSLLADVTALSGGVNAATLAAQAALDAALTGEAERCGAEDVRTASESARAFAEAARAAAELARAAAEAARAADCSALENRLDIAIEDADALVAELETAVAGLPGLSDIAGILMGNGAGGYTAAAANADYYEPPLRAANLCIPTTNWAQDQAYAAYPYRAAVEISGALVSMVPDVVFALADAVSGILAPVAQSGTDTVYVYASAIPESAVTVQTLTLWKAVAA